MAVETCAKLDLCIDAFNHAISCGNNDAAKRVLDEKSFEGYKEEALNMEKHLKTNSSPKRRSKAERRNSKKVAYLYQIPSSGQIIVHPENGGNPRGRERLPSVDMLLSKSDSSVSSSFD